MSSFGEPEPAALAGKNPRPVIVVLADFSLRAATARAGVVAAAFAATLATSLLSLVGLALLPFGAFRDKLLSPLLAFAVGSLTGDAFIHLLPRALGIAETAGEGGAVIQPQWVALVTLSGVVSFFVLERHIEHLHGPHHAHDHRPADANSLADASCAVCSERGLGRRPIDSHEHNCAERRSDSGQRAATEPLREKQPPGARKGKGRARRHRRRASRGAQRSASSTRSPSTFDIDESAPESAAGMSEAAEPQTPHAPIRRAVGWLNLTSDAIHNFVDGVAIGASFVASFEVGIATTLAVVFHEIPQELADFSILVHAGFSKRSALLFNLATACTALLGTAIGVAVGDASATAERWLLAFVAGTFLYIALADMVQTLHAIRGLRATLQQLCAVLLGVAVMLSLVYIEEAIES